MIRAILILFAYLVSLPSVAEGFSFKLVDSTNTECDHIYDYMHDIYVETNKVIRGLQENTIKSNMGFVYLGGTIFEATEDTIRVSYYSIGPDNLVVMGTVYPIHSRMFFNKMYIGSFDKEIVKDKKRFKQELERQGWNKKGLLRENIIKKEYTFNVGSAHKTIRYPGRFIMEFNGNYYLSIVGGIKQDYLVLYLMDSGLKPEEDSSCVFAY